MPECPDLAVLEGEATSAVRDHLGRCSSCRVVAELLEERRRGIDERQRIDECARFEMLIAARDEGTIGATAGELLDMHLRQCAACSAVAATLPPTNERNDFSALPAVSTAAYALGREVARGGMGRILEARDVRIGRPVAVKELLGKAPALAARFEREARVTARLQHPGIVPIYEIGKWPDGTPFYAMRMVEGRTLLKTIRDKPTLDERLALLPALIAAAEAVAFAHGKRIIHRDLTPNNILVGAYGDTVVIDWGLAKDLSDSEDDLAVGPYRDEPAAAPDLTNVGAVIGTASYMPPEQARGTAVDERADVYALGAILYHVLAGTPPYSGASEDVVRQVKSGPPPAIAAVAPGAPRDLVSLVDKAMSRDPQSRYTSAGDLADELRRFQTGRVVEAHHYSRRERLRRWARHRRAYVIGGTASLVALVIAGAIGFTGIVRERDRAEAGEAEATKQRAAAETASAELLEDAGRQELLAGHPTRAAVWLSASYTAGNQRPALRFLLARAMRDLESRERDIHCKASLGRPDVSPDETNVLAACGDTVQIWRIADGASVGTLSWSGTRWRQAMYSHDGRSVVAWNDTGDVRVWAVAGTLGVSLVGHVGRIHYASFSHDDRLIVTSGADRTVRVWDVTTGAELRRLAVSSTAAGAVRAMFVGVGHDIVSGEDDGLASLWDGDTGKLVRSVATGSLAVSTDPSGNTIDRGAACGADGVARVWDLARGVLVASFPGHADLIWTCRFSPDRTRLLTTSSDGTAKIWDLGNGHLVQAVRPGGVVNGGAFSRDGHRIVTGVLGSGVQVWDVATGALLGADDGANLETDTLRVVGDRIVVADGSTLHVWNRLGDRAAARHFAAPPGTEIVGGAGFSGERVVFASKGELTVWDVRGNRPVPHVALRGPAAGNGVRFAARTADGIAVIRLADGTTVKQVPFAGELTAIELSADGRRLLAGGPMGVVIWDVDSATELARWGAEWRVGSLSADGERVLAWRSQVGDRDPSAEIWSLSPVAAIRTLAIGRDVIWTAGFNRDHTRLVTKTGDQLVGAVSIWDLSTGKRIRVIPGALTFRLDASGDRASINFAHRSEVWRIADATRLASIADVGYVSSVDTSPDGAFVGMVDALTATYALLDATDGRLLESMPAPRSQVVSAVGYSIGTGSFSFSADASRAVIVTRPNAFWFPIDREERGAAEIAKIVETRARWRLEGTKLVEKTGPRTTLRGVVTRLGKPVSGATITVFSSEDFFSARFTVLSAPDGSFAIEDLPLVPIQVEATSSALGAFARARAVTLTGSGDQLAIEMDLAGSIEGRVLDARGAPVVGVQVFANCQPQNDSGDAVTDAGGRFRIGALSGGGTYELKLHHFGQVIGADAPLVPVRDGSDHVVGVEIRQR